MAGQSLEMNRRDTVIPPLLKTWNNMKKTLFLRKTHAGNISYHNISMNIHNFQTFKYCIVCIVLYITVNHDFLRHGPYVPCHSIIFHLPGALASRKKRAAQHYEKAIQMAPTDGPGRMGTKGNTHFTRSHFEPSGCQSLDVFWIKLPTGSLLWVVVSIFLSFTPTWGDDPL